ncbi:hypothetical protein MNV49_002885 [Pseudohyphozyma bogoriensis]|nr:hypothetical protein MNV49_002885 [Pseudohyphozyma bogoriensis]
MAKSKSKKPLDESCLILPSPPFERTQTTPLEVIDTHTHILSTYNSYVKSFPPPNNNYQTLKEFVRKIVLEQGISGAVDVWCEAPMTAQFLEVVDSLAELKEEGFTYNFVVGAHPHEAKHYDEKAEVAITKAHEHPMHQDYHYDNSPREVQQQVFRKQIRTALASGLNKALTIHTREADEDCWTILSEEVPKEQKIHIHCYTDTPEFATKMLDHFPNLFIGITGVATYSSNLNTSNVLRNMSAAAQPLSTPDLDTTKPSGLRVVLETDAPFMTPAALQKSGKKLPFSTSAMLPWTAEYIAKVLNEGRDPECLWTTEDVLRVARDNAKTLYGV